MLWIINFRQHFHGSWDGCYGNRLKTNVSSQSGGRTITYSVPLNCLVRRKQSVLHTFLSVTCHFWQGALCELRACPMLRERADQDILTREFDKVWIPAPLCFGDRQWLIQVHYWLSLLFSSGLAKRLLCFTEGCVATTVNENGFTEELHFVPNFRFANYLSKYVQ